MKSKLFALVGLLAVSATTLVMSVPAGAATSPTAPTKLVEIHTCPITGEKVVGSPAGSEVVGKYKVFFCCGGCQPEFDKLSKAQKLTKLASLAKTSK